MPLRRGTSKATIGKNIAAEENAGRPPKQAIAIGLNQARQSGASIPPGPRRRPFAPSAPSQPPRKDQ